MAVQMLGIKTKFTDDQGRPLIGGSVHTYYAGTSLPQDTFSDPELTVPNTNPVKLDDTGSANIFLEGTYRVRVFDKNGVFVEEQDNVSQAFDSTSAKILSDKLDALPFEDGVLADTFVTVTSDSGIGTVARTQRSRNQEYISVHDFGECGSGVAEDTVVMQAAIDALAALAQTDGKPRTLCLVSGLTYVVRNIKLKPLVNIVCRGGRATLKRVDVDPESPNNPTWIRIMSTNGASWQTDADFSYRCLLDGLIFDGNIEGANWAGSYSQEQASNLLIAGTAYTDLSKRVRFEIKNTIFKNSVSDGLHTVQNCDVIVSNCEAYDCFRGGLVITGGNAKVVVDGWIAENARCDMEIDSYGGKDSSLTYDVYVSISNYHQDALRDDRSNSFNGGIDLTALTDKSTLILENVHVYSGGLSWFMGSRSSGGFAKRAYINNCTFKLYSKGALIYNPIAATISNTTFLIDNRKPVGWVEGDTFECKGIDFYGSYAGYTNTNGGNFTLDNINFELLDKSPSATQPSSLITSQSYPTTNKTKIEIINSDLSSVATVDEAIRFPSGCHVKIDNVTFNTDSCFMFYGTKTGYSMPAIVEIGHIKFGSKCKDLGKLALIHREGTEENPYYGNKLIFNGFELPKHVNDFSTPAGYYYNGAEVQEGARRIARDRPPVGSDKGLKNDVFLKSSVEVGKPYEWIKLENRWLNSGNTWRATKWVTGQFATADLPELTAFDIGVENYDTTLSKFVKWSGTAWV